LSTVDGSSLEKVTGAAWFFLISAGVLEIGFTTALRQSESFTRLIPTVLFLTLSLLSFLCLEQAIRVIPLGTAYAVWTGIGAAGTAIAGIWLFGEPREFWRLFFIFLLITSIAGLKLAPGA
jgi:quaternary ammonium compound-resistance protein SugE